MICRIPSMRAAGVAACIAVLTLTAGALAAREAGGAIHPGTRVNGMRVVQGVKQDADGWLFDTICDPIVRSPGSLSRGTVELPWESRQELLGESRRVAGNASDAGRLRGGRRSRPVSLTREDKVGLVGVIDLCAGDTEGGFGGLPEGISELRDALLDDLQDATEA